MEGLVSRNSVNNVTDLDQLLLEPVRQYVHTNLMDGREASSSNVTDSVETIIRSLQAPIRSVLSQLLPGETPLACIHTINAFLRARLQEIIAIISNREASCSEVLQQLIQCLHSVFGELTALCEHFLPNGQQGLTQAIALFVAQLLGGVQGDRAEGTTVANSVLLACRLLTNLMQPSQESISRYLVTEDTATSMEDELFRGYENMRLSTPPQDLTSDGEIERMISVTPSNAQVDEVIFECEY